MANINQITVDGNIYDIEDTTARQESSGKLPLSGGTMTGNIVMGGNKVTGLPTPTDATDAVPFGDASWELYKHDVLTEDVSQYSVTWTDTDITNCLICVHGRLGGTKTDNAQTFIYFREAVLNYQVLQISNTMKSGNDIEGFAYLFSVPKKGTAALGSVSSYSYTNNMTYFAPGSQNNLASRGYLDGVSITISTNSGTISLAVGTDIKIWRKRV